MVVDLTSALAAGCAPGSDALQARAEAVLRSWGVPEPLVRPETPIEALLRTAGEPALLALILAIESSLPEPFPVDLLAAVDTIADLVAFAEVKASRLPDPAVGVRVPRPQEEMS